MAQIRMFLVSMVLVFLATGIDGTQHLMFSSNTEPVNVTRAVCQRSQLCVSVPESCDPEGTANCLFASILAGPEVAPNGTELTITMRGDATEEEYIAFGLAVDPAMGLTEFFICGGNETDRPGFFTRERNNTVAGANLTSTERVTKNIRRNATAGKVRCQFTIPNVNSTTSSNILTRTTNFAVVLANGTLVDGSPGLPNVLLTTLVANLSNPNAVIRPTAIPATTSSTPPSFGSPVSLLLCAVLAWLTLLRM